MNIIETLKNEVSFINGCDIKPFNKGASHAKLFIFEKGKQQYILKVYEEESSAKLKNIELYKDLNIPTPQIKEFGKTKNFGFFVIMDYIKSGTLEENYNNLLVNEIKSLATNFAKTQLTLSKSHNLTIDKQTFYKDFLSKEKQRYDKCLELIYNNADKLPNIKNFNFEILDKKFNKLIKSFENEEVYYIDFDIKSNNLLLKDNQLLVIDYEKSQPYYIAASLRGEVCKLFGTNSEIAKKSWTFIKNIIIGISNQKISIKTKKQLLYCFIKDSFIFEIRNAIENKNYEFANSQLEMINNVLINKIHTICKNKMV